MVNLKRQRGIVLVSALIMVLLVTGIAVTVMTTSSIDTKMVVASQQAYNAEANAKGDSERAIQTEIAANGNNRFLYKRGQFSGAAELDISPNVNSKVMLSRLNTNAKVEMLECPPKFAVTKGIKCNYLNIRTTHNYGKQDRHEMVINTGIQQELIDN